MSRKVWRNSNFSSSSLHVFNPFWFKVPLTRASERDKSFQWYIFSEGTFLLSTHENDENLHQLVEKKTKWKPRRVLSPNNSFWDLLVKCLRSLKKKQCDFFASGIWVLKKTFSFLVQVRTAFIYIYIASNFCNSKANYNIFYIKVLKRRIRRTHVSHTKYLLFDSLNLTLKNHYFVRKIRFSMSSRLLLP